MLLSYSLHDFLNKDYKNYIQKDFIKTCIIKFIR